MMFFVVLVLLLITYIWFLTKKPNNYPPGPIWYPFLGSGYVLKKFTTKYNGMHKAIEKLNQLYNSNILGFKLGNERYVIISSFSLIKNVLHRDEFEGKPDNFFIKLRCMGSKRGITMTDGLFSKIQRRFVKSHLRDLGFGKEHMDRLLQEETQDVVKYINSFNGECIEFSKIIPLSVINVLWAMTVGKKMDRSDRKLLDLLRIMKERSLLFDLAGGVLNQFPWLRFVAPDRMGYNMIRHLNEQFKNYIQQTIDSHKEKWTAGNKSDLIYAFITKMKEEVSDYSTFTEDQLVMVCMDLFIAGSVSTSNTLESCFLMMILYPDVQEKVQVKLDEAFKANEEINYKERNRVPYVEAVLNEIQRFCSIAPISGPRRVAADVELEGYTIPKNTTILYSIYSSHFDKDYWKDPEVFRPERFLTEDGLLKTHDRFMPFAIGSRRCLGEILAKSFMFTFFCEILRQFTIKADPDSPGPTGKMCCGMLTSSERYKAKLARRICY